MDSVDSLMAIDGDVTPSSSSSFVHSATNNDVPAAEVDGDQIVEVNNNEEEVDDIDDVDDDDDDEVDNNNEDDDSEIITDSDDSDVETDRCATDERSPDGAGSGKQLCVKWGLRGASGCTNGLYNRVAYMQVPCQSFSQ